MEPYGGPAALGGVMAGLMLASWMLGRWQGGLAGSPGSAPLAALPDPAEARATGTAGQRPARAERLDMVDMSTTLSALHADVSAYRIAQQVHTGAMLAEGGRGGWTAAPEDVPSRRRIAQTDQPPSPNLSPGDPRGEDGPCPVEAQACGPKPVQPSPDPFALTRL